MRNSGLIRALFVFCATVALMGLAQSSWAARKVKPCGGENQRACCVGEKSFGACKRGLHQKAQRNSGWCKGKIFQSNGVCIRVTACGKAGQRACCLGEKRFGACEKGTAYVHKANTGWCKGMLAQSMGKCVKLTPCGGNGQRACCVLEAKFGACKAGLFEHPASNTGWCKGGVVQSSGICKSHTPCGGLGQRACCIGEGRNCRRGLKEIAGCTGDCACPRGYSNGMCSKRGRIGEPTVGWTKPRRPARGLTGYADLHMHLFAHMGHGGKTLHGQPYHGGGVNSALSSCRHAHGKPHVMALNKASTIGDGTNDMKSLTGRAVDSDGGAPLFNGWPTWRSTIHQQVYYKWLERAWRGGLRLMVELAVTNEALCISTGGSNCSTSMVAIDAQIKATRDLERYIGKRGGWFKIVKSPAEARAAIRSGKLAVVQGIEVDNLFNCKVNDRGCTAKFVRARVNQYYRKGVRHVFPIHNFDNKFGGPATWQDVIEVGNRAVEGAWWSTENCPRGYGFKLGNDNVKKAIALMFGFKKFDRMPKHRGTASCNKHGLTKAGEALIGDLMDKGMMIDIDHMSNKSITRTFELAEARRPAYPVVASHVQFFDLNQQSIRHERMRTRAQLKRIAKSGGMIAAMLKDDFQDTPNVGKQLNVRYGRSVANNCRHSSKTWAQMLQYAVDTMGGPVAMGSDFNGVAGHIGPRFGSDACGANRREQLAQKKRLAYPFSLPGFGSLTKQVSGYRTFDFNVDGLAHVGLLPDLVADVVTVGLPRRYVDKLFQSAEKYIQVWERATRSRR